MAGLKIEKQELLTVRGSDGSEVKINDLVVMRTYRDEDVLCRFKGMQAGYIITETMDGKTENRYRVNSIADCKVVEHIEIRKGDEE